MTALKLKNAALLALKENLLLLESETILILTDSKMSKIGRAFYEASKTISKSTFYMEMPDLLTNGEEPPNQLIDIMRSMDVVIAATSRTITHTGPRHQATKGGVRIATIGEMSDEAFVRNMNADLNEIISLSDKVKDLMKGVKKIHITSKAGTDLYFELDSKRDIKTSTGLLKNIGSWGNLPSGEVYVAPIEEETNGKIVIDATVAGMGMIKSPITVEIESGLISNISGKGKDVEKFSEMMNNMDDEGRIVGELGIGTNGTSILSGYISEDEKVLGTCHVGFGNNFSFGGIITAPSHIDCVIQKPTITFDKKVIMKDGKLAK